MKNWLESASKIGLKVLVIILLIILVSFTAYMVSTSMRRNLGDKIMPLDSQSSSVNENSISTLEYISWD